MLRGEPGDLDVVDAQGADPGQRAADADDRLLEVEQARHLAGSELEGDGDHGIHPFAQQKVLENAATFFAAPTQVVESEVVAVAEQGALGAFDHRAEEPLVEERDDDTDVPRSTGGEPGGARTHDVAELLGCPGDALASGHRHVPVAAQGAPDGRRRNSGQIRDLIDARHSITSRAEPILAAILRGASDLYPCSAPSVGEYIRSGAHPASYPSGQRDLTV